MRGREGAILAYRLMIAPSPSLASRAPRVRATEYTPAVLRFQSGDCVTGSLEVFSSTGGLLSLQKPLIRGTRIKVMFLTQNGPVLGAAEMLSPVSWTQQPFRFVALAYVDQRRLQAITGSSVKVEKRVTESAVPEPANLKPADLKPSVLKPSLPESAIPILHTETDWIDKYRAAVSSNPPRKPLLERVLGVLISGTK